VLGRNADLIFERRRHKWLKEPAKNRKMFTEAEGLTEDKLLLFDIIFNFGKQLLSTSEFLPRHAHVGCVHLSFYAHYHEKRVLCASPSPIFT
jgi:hypothetical protein